MRKRLPFMLGMIAVAVSLLAAPASAAGSGTINGSAGSEASPVQITVPSGYTTGSTSVPLVTFSASVQFSGMSANSQNTIYMQICKRPTTAPGFNNVSDCSLASLKLFSNTGSGSGTVTFNGFRGDEPSGDLTWGCYATGDTQSPDNSPQVTPPNTCYLRVTDTQPSATTNQFSIPFRFVVANDPVIPEVPFAVLLPVVAVAAGGGYLLLRNRRQARTA